MILATWCGSNNTCPGVWTYHKKIAKSGTPTINTWTINLEDNPAIKIIPRIIKQISSVEERLGCFKIKSSGIPQITASFPNTFGSFRSSWCFARNAATTMIMITLLSSDGWKVPNGPNENHRLAPLTSFPNNLTPINMITFKIYNISAFLVKTW